MIVDEWYATILTKPGTEPPDTRRFAALSAEYAVACERLADAWPDQAIGEHGYSDGAKVANHLRIVAATVRGVARRVG